LVGIYLAESTVGAGTVVGSTPFNLCCICGGASLAVGGNLLLNPWIIGRETLGLIGAALLFLWTLQDSRVMYYEAIVIFVYYILYVLVLAFFPQILKTLFNVSLKGEPEEPVADSAGSAKVSMSQLRASGNWVGAALPGASSAMQSSQNSGLRQSVGQTIRQSLGLTRASVQNSLSQALLQTEPPAWEVPRAGSRAPSANPSQKGGRSGQEMELLPVGPGSTDPALSQAASIESGQAAGEGEVAGDVADSATWTALVRDCRKRVDASQKPSSTALANRTENSDSGTGTAKLSGVLLKKSRFYTKLRVGSKVWQPRWFVLDDHPTQPLRYSRLDGSLDNAVCVDLREVTKIERADPTQLVLVTPSQTYRLKIPPSEAFTSSKSTASVQNVDSEAAETAQLWFDHIVFSVNDLRKKGPPSAKDEHPVDDQHEHEVWYHIPSKEDPLGLLSAVLTFPVKAMVHLTLADVRIPGKEKYYPVTMVASAMWLALFAFILTFMIEYIGCAIGLSVTVVGLSLGAVGTSFPNLYASILTARAGQGELSISQAIGANTYNICLGLGFLWIFKSLAGHCIYGNSGNKNLGPCNGCYNVEGNDPFCPYLKSAGSLQATTPGSLQGTIVVSLIWILAFWIILFFGKNRLTRVPAGLMFLWYLAYILYEIIINYATSLTPICVNYLPHASIFSNFCF
jgi:Ca2+/Na+ antiporter